MAQAHNNQHPKIFVGHEVAEAQAADGNVFDETRPCGVVFVVSAANIAAVDLAPAQAAIR
jgi:hypothetical protein